MQKLLIWSLVVSLGISMAAPYGAVFALEGEEALGEIVIQGVLAEETGDSVEGSDDGDDGDQNTGLGMASDNESSNTEDDQTGTDESSAENKDESSDDSESDTSRPDVVIAQIQVGVSGSSGDEYVSIYNNSNEVVDVTGWCLRNKSNRNFACLNEPETDYMMSPGAFISFSSVAGRGLENSLVLPFLLIGNQIIGSSDTIELIHGDEVVDTISWTSQATGRYAIERLRSLVEPHKLLAQKESWAWRVQLEFYGYIAELIECADGSLAYHDGQCVDVINVNFCDGLVLSEIGANIAEQFIELQNTGKEPVSLGGCQLQTNRTSKTFIFEEDMVLGPEGYFAVAIVDTELTLTKTTSGQVYLLSSDGLTEIDSVSYKNLTKETSWSLFDDGWKQTFAVSPSEPNEYMRYLPCEEGYWRNEETGRCNKVVTPTVPAPCRDDQYRSEETGRCRNIASATRQLVPCREGQYRSEETNRCRSIASAVSSLKPCADDQFRNPLTNRCKKIASAEDVALADCGEGRERNPATNRCRNIISATMPAAPFAPDEVTRTARGMLGWWALGGVSLVALGYAGWQWRFEVGRLVRRIGQAFVSGGKE